jgi:hypothetical protein
MTSILGQQRICVAIAAALTLSCLATARAGTIEIPAWAFTRGNGRIHVDPKEYADAGPVVGSGDREPWGWSLEYDVEYPVAGMYRLYIQYASAESRPISIRFDSRDISKCCLGISLKPGGSGEPTSKSSGARTELVLNRFGGPDNLSINRKQKARGGKHTIVLTSREPLPHLISLRLTTSEPFPEDWQPPKYKLRDLASIPTQYRGLFAPPKHVDVAALRRPVADPTDPKFAGTLTIPAWTFDRGNARIYASPDEYANAGPMIGGGTKDGHSFVEYDIDFPVAGDYTLIAKYASADARPTEVLLDNKSAGWCCNGVVFNSPPHQLPLVTSDDSWDVIEEREGVTVSAPKGTHTLKLSRQGPLPHLVSLKLGSHTAFPKGWKQPQRLMTHFVRVPPEHQSVFLPADSVNMPALRQAIENTIRAYGPDYPGGQDYIDRLAAFEKKEHKILIGAPVGKTFKTARTWLEEESTPTEQRTIEKDLAALRREALLAHPALKFDKLLFVKRTPFWGHIYEDQHNWDKGGNIYMLSPVRPDGIVTKLLPELDGGTFGRFDLSYDATKVVFCYAKKLDGISKYKKDNRNKEGKGVYGPFHIYEFRLDPKTGLKIPGSLRQLTFSGGKEEADAIKSHTWGRSFVEEGFHDTAPCYLPNDDIVFLSARPQRCVFCFPSTSASLHVMDADGKNMRCISQGTLPEMAPSVMNDGRVVYTRWEYVDKGLGNGQAIWSIRPDGSGVDHVFKNSTMRPSGMMHTRGIPGSQRLVSVANAHCGREGGAVVLIDNRATRRTAAAIRSLTPEIAYPCMYRATAHMGYFQTPYPFSEDFYVVSHALGSDDKHYGIYVLDRWGNRAEVYNDPNVSSFLPVPLRPRRKPAQLAPTAVAAAEPQEAHKKTGTMFIQDIYQGMTGIERGRIKYVRVMGVLPWPWGENGIFRIGLAGAVHRKKIYGLAKVHEDGSASFTVPAEQNLLFQALDENYMQVQHMPTFINMRPGEKRSCIGCHEHRRQAPTATGARPLALTHPVQDLTPQPGDDGPRTVHYATDVQATFDKRCISCHSGDKAKAGLSLTGEPTTDWCRSYESIFGKGLVAVRHSGYGRSQYVPQTPLHYGSHLSKLTAHLREDPCKGELTKEEFIRIVTWMDANIPFYGTYRGKRDLKYTDEPDFRPPPLVVKQKHQEITDVQ